MKTSQSTTSQGQRIDVLGLGNMGLGMAVTLRAAGWHVTGYDPDPSARLRAASEGLGCADHLNLLQAPVVILSLPGAEVVEECVPQLLAQERMIAILDTTTSEPQTSRAMEALAAGAGSSFVDAPVSGGRVGAWSGGLTAFVGGTDAAVVEVAPALDCLTSRWTHLGAIGSGNVVKLLNNMLCAANLASVAEAIDVLAAHGLDIETGLEALNAGSGRSAVSQVSFADSILKGDLVGGFAVGLMARDVRLGLSVAREAGATPSVLAVTDDVWAHALEKLGPEADCNTAPSTFTTATTCLDPSELAAATTGSDLAGARHGEH